MREGNRWLNNEGGSGVVEGGSGGREEGCQGVEGRLQR